jgi:hypothetical protein
MEVAVRAKRVTKKEEKEDWEDGNIMRGGCNLF